MNSDDRDQRVFPEQAGSFSRHRNAIMAQSEPTPADASPSKHLSPWRDIATVAAVTVTAALLAAHFELNEQLFALTRRWEHLQADEWPIAIFTMALCLMWLSRRRYRQALAELRARQAAEARLAEALALNRQLAHQHLTLQESERKHLARELHDELGQYLNAIKIDAVTLREPTDGETAFAVSERVVKSVDHVHGVVSDMIRRLRPAGLDELGLVAAIENCVDHWRQRMPARTFSLRVRGSFDGLPELTNLTLYRLVQEGLTNSHKHADAARVDIELSHDAAAADELVLCVSDDGRGAESQQAHPGYGLRGMQERIEMLGGRFSIDTSPGAGFAFEARLPASGA